MKIHVSGNSVAVQELRTLLKAGSYAISESNGTYTFDLNKISNQICNFCRHESGPVDYIIVDSIDSELERLAIGYMEELGVPKFMIHRADGNRSERKLDIQLPEKFSSIVALGIYRAVDKMLNKSPVPTPDPMKKRKFFGLLPAGLLLALFPSLALAQNQNSIIRFWNPTLDQIVAAGDVANNALRVNVVAGGAGGGLSQLQVRSAANAWTDVGFFGGNLNVPVNCVVGCSGSSFADSSAFTFTTTPIGLSGFVVDDVSTNTVAENSAGLARMNANRIPYSDLSLSASNTNPFLVSGTVSIGNTVTVSGTFQTMVDDGSFTPLSDRVFPAGFYAGSDTVDVGDIAAPRMSTSRIQYVTPSDPTGIPATFTNISGKYSQDVLAAGTFAESSSYTASSLGVHVLFRDTESGTNRYLAPATDASGKLFTHPQNELHETFNFKTIDADLGGGTDNRAFVGILLPKSGGGVAGGTSTDPIRVDPTGTTAQPVTGTFWQTTQPVSWSSQTVTATQGTGSNLHVVVDTAPTTAVTGTFWQTTQPIAIDQTGNNNAVDVLTMPTVTVSQGTGTNLHAVIDSGSTTAVTQGTGTNLHTVVDSGSITATQGTGSNLHTVVDSGTITTITNSVTVGQGTAANLNVRTDESGATASAVPARAAAIGGAASGADTTGLLSVLTVCTEHVAVNISTATTTLVITGVANRHIRICSINLVTAAANNVALINGTGATCGTSTAGMNGGTTAASGWNFAANGGIAQGSGIGEIMSTKVSGGATGDSVCIVTSAGTQLSGTIGYAIY